MSRSALDIERELIGLWEDYGVASESRPADEKKCKAILDRIEQLNKDLRTARQNERG